MSAEILDITPTSGSYSERHFGDHFNYRLWVKFDNTTEEWVGCFSRPNNVGLDKVLIDKENLTAFVVAGGQGYLVDIVNKVLLVELEEQPLIESAIITTNPNYFIAGTFYSIYILNNKQLVKEVRPDLIIDGIYFSEQQDNEALGKIATAENQYERNLDFVFDLKTFELGLNYVSKEKKSQPAKGFFRRLWKKN